MTDRTFNQYAQGYGSVPAQIVFQIDGNNVFSGPISTLDQPSPSLPDAESPILPLAWTWQDSADFTGTKQISISVSGSWVLLGPTLANNPYGNVGNINQFKGFYQQEIDGVTYFDPFTNEDIDGVAQSGPFQASEPGQWWWQIPAGSTFTATMHVTAPPASLT